MRCAARIGIWSEISSGYLALFRNGTVVKVKNEKEKELVDCIFTYSSGGELGTLCDRFKATPNKKLLKYIAMCFGEKI